MNSKRLVPRGVINGLIGAAIVAIWFFAVDLTAGRPLFTPSALGSALFFGAQGPEEIRQTAGVMLGYSAVHILVFMMVGLLVVGVADYLERAPSRKLLVLLFAITLEALALPTIATLAQWVLRDLGIWTVAAANLLAGLAMGWHALKIHPALEERLPQSAVDV
jgi:hypothetical protein